MGLLRLHCSLSLSILSAVLALSSSPSFRVGGPLDRNGESRFVPISPVPLRAFAAHTFTALSMLPVGSDRVNVLRGEFVAVFAVSFPCVQSAGSDSTAYILSHGYGFEMERIDARLGAAKMIQNQSGWNLSNCHLISHPVSAVRLAAHGNLAVSVGVKASRIDQTRAGGSAARKDGFIKVSEKRSRRHKTKLSPVYHDGKVVECPD